MIKQDKLYVLFFIALAIILLVHLRYFLSTQTRIGIRESFIFPQIILVGLIVTSILLIIFERGMYLDRTLILGKTEFLHFMIFPITVILLIYFVVYVGLIVSIFFFTLLWMFFLKMRNPKIIFPISLAITVVIYFLYQQVGVFVPDGILF